MLKKTYFYKLTFSTIVLDSSFKYLINEHLFCQISLLTFTKKYITTLSSSDENEFSYNAKFKTIKSLFLCYTS